MPGLAAASRVKERKKINGSSHTASCSERARWCSTATITLAVHPWHGETVGVSRRFGDKAVWIECESGARRIVPVS